MNTQQTHRVFYRKQYKEIAKLIATFYAPDNIIQELTNSFGRMFSKDSTKFDFTRFQSLVTRLKEGSSYV